MSSPPSRLLFLGACALLTGAAGGAPPLWVTQPKGDDSVHTYQIGHAVAADLLTARQAALTDARNRFLDTWTGTFSVRAAAHARRILAPEGLAPVPGGEHVVEEPGRVELWLQASLPIKERQHLLDLLESSRKLNADYAAACAAPSADPTVVASTISNLLERLSSAVAPDYDAGDLYLWAGRALAATHPLDARDWLERATATSGAAADAAREVLHQLPPPPRAWSLRTLAGQRTLATAVFVHDATGWSPFTALASALVQEAGLAGMAASDVSTDLTPLLPAHADELLQGTAPVQDHLPAPVACLLVVTYEPAAGNRLPAGLGLPSAAMPDTSVRFALLDLHAGRVLKGGVFKDVRAGVSEAKVVERGVSALLGRHLAAKSPVP